MLDDKEDGLFESRAYVFHIHKNKHSFVHVLRPSQLLMKGDTIIVRINGSRYYGKVDKLVFFENRQDLNTDVVVGVHFQKLALIKPNLLKEPAMDISALDGID